VLLPDGRGSDIWRRNVVTTFCESHQVVKGEHEDMKNPETSVPNPQGDGAQRSLVEGLKHAEGRHGGFCFGGQTPDGVTTVAPLPPGTIFPNGATAALLLTFDVEGTYSNGTGDMVLEVANYERICAKLKAAGIVATFNIVGQMAEEQGPAFVRWILDAGCEVAAHGYVHDMNRRYDPAKTYAGHYGPPENTAQVREALAVFDRIQKGCVRGVRMPYAHFNEYTYDAIAAPACAGPATSESTIGGACQRFWRGPLSHTAGRQGI